MHPPQHAALWITWAMVAIYLVIGLLKLTRTVAQRRDDGDWAEDGRPRPDRRPASPRAPRL